MMIIGRLEINTFFIFFQIFLEAVINCYRLYDLTSSRLSEYRYQTSNHHHA